MSIIPDQLFHMGGVPVGAPEVGPRSHVVSQTGAYFVDGNSGSDNKYSGTDWKAAFATLQGAVDKANSRMHRTDNVDIYVANGQYEETVQIRHSALNLSVAEAKAGLLWTNMGLNCGTIGRLRIIGPGGVFGAGHAKWTCGTTATDPPLYIGRPNVEIHNFNFQMNETGGVAAGSWGDGDEMGGHGEIAMPAIFVEDQYNIDPLIPSQVLANGAGNNVLINNCRVNSGGAGVLNSGAKWVHVTGSMLEYCTHGVAMVGNSKGKASESLVYDSRFSQNYNDICHGVAICCWVDACRFLTVPTGYHIFPLAAHAASTFCVVSNSTGTTEAKWGETLTKNSGWIAQNLTCTDDQHLRNAANLATGFIDS